MAIGKISQVIQHLRSTALLHDGGEPTDGQLLECFIREREATALEGLVRRHGPMVWGVCNRILRNHHDAEDAFQAAFLVLVRKASSIKPREMVGNWLYGVAYQTAIKARASGAKRHARERQGTDMPEPAVPPPDLVNELTELLDRELTQLPDKYRTVVILCELEGKLLKDVAQQLRLPLGTVASRLARGRSMLAKRLARHGLAVSGVSLAALLPQQTVSASVPTALLFSTIQAAAGSIVSAHAAALAEGVVKAMLLAKLAKWTAAALLIIACCGVGYVAHADLAAGQTDIPNQVAQTKEPAAAEEKSSPRKEAADSIAQEAKEKEKPKEKDKKDPKAKTRKPKFTVGKETTYAVGPLDKAGYIDYETALNEKLREGVTPKNNANVLLFKAFGPHPDGANMSEEFFKWMKVAAPPEKGDYFVRAGQFGTQLDDPAQKKKFFDDIEKVIARSWSAKDYPDIAAWLKLNEKPLAVAIEASKRTHYYYPLLGNRKDGKTQGLLTARVAGVQLCREVIGALTARAMLRVAEKRYDDAWQDLLACHRLGRLVGHGGTLIEGLVGIALDNLACNADVGFLDGAKLDSKQLKKCLADLQALPPMPAMADKLSLTERYWFLECIMIVDREGVGYLDIVSGRGQREESSVMTTIGNFAFADMEWDTALRDSNRMYDRLAAAMRLKDRGIRDKQIGEINVEIRTLKASLTDPKAIAGTFLGAKNMADAKGKYLGVVMICLFVPATLKVMQANDRMEQTQQNVQLAFALAAYKSDEGRYPMKLDALAPKYLATIQKDLFSGKALIYRPTEKGYLLYSVGVNGRDEEGRGYDDDPRGDDLSVRMPLPKLREK